ncbi:unnamed protein product [Durusdinium trenchii]|uniref:Uncharacterized protein n=1 Tax=Durusdinium trenchii TaxID=1381693 RepID=A0ABP0I3Y2_9DINO
MKKGVGVLIPIVAAVVFLLQSEGRLKTSVPGGKGSSATEKNLWLATSVGGFEVCLVICLHLLKRQREQTWQGANIEALIPCLAIGWIIRFLCPIPAGVSDQAWSMLSIFVSMIVAVVLRPLPPAAATVVAMSVVVFTGTATLAQGLKAFTDEVVWLVVIAFFLADGFQKTGLGDRIALNVIRAVGGTTVGLAYGLNFAELMVAATMPCSAARAAAVFYPITKSVCKASGSDPDEGTEFKCGKFLVECCYQATATSSCMFLTGAAQNYFVLKLAEDVGVHVEHPFHSWFTAAVIPASVSFLLTPLIALKLLPPDARTTPDAPKVAQQRLDAMGPISIDEKVFLCVMLGMVALWASTSLIHISPAVTAFCGIGLLLMTGVITWEDCARNQQAWSTFVSFAILVGLAERLKSLGIVEWVSSVVTSRIRAAGLAQVPAFLVIVTAYWLIHYLFASQVAHVSALFQPFLVMLVETGTPGIPAVFALAFVSNLFATLTPYASAQSAVLFAGHYITAFEWYKAGFVYMLAYYIQWLVVGAVWWRMIGLV